MNFSTRAVLHCDYGGFDINTEMALWLVEHRNWKVISDKAYDYNEKSNFPLTTLIETIWPDSYYNPYQHEISFRSHPDLIDCVETLQKQHKGNRGYSKAYNDYICKLQIVEVNISLGIESYNDGHERITCDCSINY